MFPWIKEALDLSCACRSLRLAQDRKGVWRPAATPTDVEAAFAEIARILRESELAAWDVDRRVEETERLRMALQAMNGLCLGKGIPTDEIARTLEPILMGDIPEDAETAPPAWTLVPKWARKRAKRRIAASRERGTSTILEESAPPPLAFSAPWGR